MTTEVFKSSRRNVVRLAKLGKVSIVGKSTINRQWTYALRRPLKEFRILGEGCYAAAFEDTKNPDVVYKVLYDVRTRAMSDRASWIERKNMDGYLEYLRRVKDSGDPMYPRIYQVKTVLSSVEDEGGITYNGYAVIKMERLEPIKEIDDVMAFGRVKELFRKTKVYRDLTQRYRYCDDMHRNNVMMRVLPDGKRQAVITDPFC